MQLLFEKTMVSFQITIHSKKFCRQTHKNYSVNKLAIMKQVELQHGEIKTQMEKDTIEILTFY
jgi:hypothetical protein